MPYPETEDDVRMIARDLMDQWGLYDWTLEFSSMKRALGKTKYQQKVISLSKPTFVDLGMRFLHESHGVRSDLLEDVMLHEIAHALNYEENREGGHGRSWKRMARRVGADPTRQQLFPESVEKLMAPWVRSCPECDYSQYLYRKPGSSAARKACGRCCKRKNGGDFSERFALELHENTHQIL